MAQDLTANIHSIETAGTLDGPGLRYVIFFNGCPLKCKFCHNPDTWLNPYKNNKTVSEIVQDILKYKEFFMFSGGGVTVTGGEPLLQKDFVLALFKELKKHSIHTVIDTCGYVEFDTTIEKIISYTDLCLFDIKHLDSVVHKDLTTKPNGRILRFFEKLAQVDAKVWLRYVLLPSYNDSDKYVDQFIDFVKHYKNIEQIELLPYHEMGKTKWEALGHTYQLDINPPDKDLVTHVAQKLTQSGLAVSR